VSEESDAAAIEAQIERAAPYLRAARFVVVLTGAGLSADSGLATYRTGDNALWSPENMRRFANPEGFRANFSDAWAWYQARRESMLAARPNDGHLAIAQMQTLIPELLVVTQNIDSLHQRAGTGNVVEYHGSLAHAVCWDCNRKHPWPQPNEPAELSCHACGGMLRPDVVFFRELLNPDVFGRAELAARNCDVFMSVGTSNTVAPAANLPWMCAKRNKPVIVVNPDMTGQRDAPTVIPICGRAAEILPRLVRRAWSEFAT